MRQNEENEFEFTPNSACKKTAVFQNIKMADYKEKASTSDQQNYNSRQSLINDHDLTQNSSKLPRTEHEMTTAKKNKEGQNLISEDNELDHL